MTKSVRVFISHSHEDKVLSAAVEYLLSNTLGLSDEEILNTSQASSGIKPGSGVHDQIVTAMDSAESVIVLITPASGERPWVQFESGGAFFRNKPLYVLIHPSAETPGTFSKKPVAIDRVDEVANLIDAIREDLKIEKIAGIAKTIKAVSSFVAEAKAYNPECTILHFENRLEIQIGYGDVLEWPDSIALPCDNRYDVSKHAEGGQLYGHTIIGQFRKRFLPNLKVDDFRQNMVERLGGTNISDVFKIGHVCAKPLFDNLDDQSDRRKLFLVVLFSVKERYGVIEGAAKAENVWYAYENLWNEVSAVRPETVAAPLFGSGQSSSGLSRQQSCTLAVLSAVCISLRNPIYPRLHLLCHDRDSYRALNVRAIAGATGLEHGPRS